MHTASVVHCQQLTCLWIIFTAETSVADDQLKEVLKTRLKLGAYIKHVDSTQLQILA